MKDFWKNLTKKQIVLAVTAVISLLIFIGLTIGSNVMKENLESQTMAKRWSKEGGVSQISCFFSKNGNVDENTIMAFEHSLDASLK